MAGSRIERVAKEVVVLRSKDGGMFVSDPSIDRALYAGTIADIRDCIEKGEPIPERFYRRSTGIDHLLKERGWLHLHVDLQPPDDVLLIVEEAASGVIFIGLCRHAIFEERPRGRSLFGLRSKVATEKARLAARAKRDTKKLP